MRATVLAALVLLLLSTAARADEVKLRQGDVLRGKILERTREYLVLDHPDLGRIIIPYRRILVTFPPAPQPIEDEHLRKEIDEILDLPEIAEPETATKWSLSAVFGGTLTNNDDGQKLVYNFRLGASRATRRAETEFDLTYLFEWKNEALSENNLTARLGHTIFSQKTPWTYFGRTRYDYDDFRSWTQRVLGHLGVGYRVADDAKIRFTLQGGVGGRQDFGSDDEATRVEGLLGFDLVWKPDARQALQLNATYYPSLNEDDYRVVVVLDWKLLISRVAGLSFNTHLDYEYATDPDLGFPPNNIRLTWGLQYDF
jgi:hypothetical protein